MNRFLRRSEGQDLSEYCLLTALVALIALGIFWHASGGIAALWSNSNTSLETAGTVAGSGVNATSGASSPQNGDVQH